MRWAREKLLEGFNVSGWIKVTRASVERLKDSPIVARERAYQRELDQVLDAFDVGDGPLPESILPHIGRAPWTLLPSKSPEQSSAPRQEPVRVLVDTNAFARRERGMAPLVKSARAGHIELLWVARDHR